VNKGQQYTPYCLLRNRTVAMNSVTFKSASKAFSLSAMKCGWMFSDNGDYIARIAATGHSGDINTLGVVAAQAAYTGGEEYLNQLVAYIDGNHEYVEKFVKSKIPLIRYQKPQGTYLAWLDVTGAVAKLGAQGNLTPEQHLQDFLVKEAKVQINAGSNYGASGAGHMRMNLATSRRTIQLALNNIASALQKL
jgi:cystathionine beta-lyase